MLKTKYTYQIQISSVGFYITESKNYPSGAIAETVWAGWEFLGNLYLAELKDGSFFRTKKWLENNYPEFLL